MRRGVLVRAGRAAPESGEISTARNRRDLPRNSGRRPGPSRARAGPGHRHAEHWVARRIIKRNRISP